MHNKKNQENKRERKRVENSIGRRQLLSEIQPKHEEAHIEMKKIKCTSKNITVLFANG